MTGDKEKVLLLTSGRGEIGRNVLEYALKKGFRVVSTTHTKPIPQDEENVKWVHMDFTDKSSHRSETWREIMDEEGVTHVAEAAMLFQGKKSTLIDVNYKAPKALIDAADEHGVEKYIQISSLNTRDIKGELTVWDSHRDLRNHLETKGNLNWTEVAPGHVYHTNAGQGCKIQYHLMAALNIHLEFKRDALMQPIHVSEISEGVVNLLENSKAKQKTLPAVGPNSFGHNELLDRIQKSIGIAGKDLVLKVNKRMAKLVGRAMKVVNKVIPNDLTTFFDKNTVMLNMYDNTADPSIFAEAADIKLKRMETHFKEAAPELLKDIAKHSRLMLLMHKVDPELHSKITNLEAVDWKVKLNTDVVHLYYDAEKGGIPEGVKEAAELITKYHLTKGRVNKGPVETGVWTDEKKTPELKMTSGDLAIMSSLVTEFKDKKMEEKDALKYIDSIMQPRSCSFFSR